MFCFLEESGNSWF